MVNNYEKNLLERYLKPVEIENKEFYYSLIYEISESLTSGIIVDLFHSNKINMIITIGLLAKLNKFSKVKYSYPVTFMIILKRFKKSGAKIRKLVTLKTV